MRATVAGLSFPLRLPSAGPARATAAAVVGQIDDYALPRLAHPDAPMLVVVGGSTGAGKSTLVNSLVRAPVSAAGVLRPTTRAPVLVCHPTDTRWFRSDRLLGGLPRTTAAAAATDRDTDPRRLTIMAAPALPPGLAFLDAPDIDSVVAANRELSDQLFAAADLWLFLTTPARYADAVPWRLLHTARERGTVVALVLSRVLPEATAELVELLGELLIANDLASLPLFVLPETRVDGQGQLPDAATGPLRSWFDGLAGDPATRAGVIRYTLNGTLAAVPPRLAELAAAAAEQLAAAEGLAEQVGLAYGVARGTVERGVRDGALRLAEPAPDQRAPVDEFARALRTTIGGWRDRVAVLTGRRAGPRHRRTAVESGLVTLVGSAATDAAEQTGLAWRAHPAGSALLTGDLPDQPAPPGAPAGSELTRRLHRVAREWQTDDLLERVNGLLDDEARRWLDRLDGAPLDAAPAQRLREVAVALERARVAARLTADQVVPAEPADTVDQAEAEEPAEDVEQPAGPAPVGERVE